MINIIEYIGNLIQYFQVYFQDLFLLMLVQRPNIAKSMPDGNIFNIFILDILNSIEHEFVLRFQIVKQFVIGGGGVVGPCIIFEEVLYVLLAGHGACEMLDFVHLPADELEGVAHREEEAVNGVEIGAGYHCYVFYSLLSGGFFREVPSSFKGEVLFLPLFCFDFVLLLSVYKIGVVAEGRKVEM